MELKQLIKCNPVMGILRNIPLEDTLPYVNAVYEGGIHFFEVALNSMYGLEEIALLKKEFGSQIIIGAGTAVTVELAVRARDAGADFLLTPNTDERILEYCAKNNVCLMPGVMTPSEVGICQRYGFKVLKLFPAGELPLRYVKTIKGPFDGTDYVAIGGVGSSNWKEFMENGYLGVGIGSSLIPKGLRETKSWREITDFVKHNYSWERER